MTPHTGLGSSTSRWGLAASAVPLASPQEPSPGSSLSAPGHEGPRVGRHCGVRDTVMAGRIFASYSHSLFWASGLPLWASVSLGRKTAALEHSVLAVPTRVGPPTGHQGTAGKQAEAESLGPGLSPLGVARPTLVGGGVRQEELTCRPRRPERRREHHPRQDGDLAGGGWGPTDGRRGPDIITVGGSFSEEGTWEGAWAEGKDQVRPATR